MNASNAIQNNDIFDKDPKIQDRYEEPKLEQEKVNGKS